MGRPAAAYRPAQVRPEAIDGRCAADDAQRVHVQLGGGGGGDKVIYTYHLTRFSTALSERCTLPPDRH